MRSNGGVPVLMFHSVRPKKHISGNLSVSLETFAACMSALAASRYRTATLQELYEHKMGTARLPEKTVILTFDDGFLDNWTFVYPVLKYHSLKATVFPSIDFIGEGPSRETIRYDGKLPGDLSGLEYTGSLRWSELRTMVSSGVFDVQSHTVTHDRYFSAPRIVGFTGDSRNYSWMAWNLYPDRKHELLESTRGLIPDGIPVWEFGRSLGVNRFSPSTDLESHVISTLRNRLGEDYFKNNSSTAISNSIVSEWKIKNGFPGKMETDEEYLQRVEYELNDSRVILENKLGKPVKFLCWPGGARTDIALSIVKDCGYIASTSPSALRGKNRNAPGENPEDIWRIGSCMKWNWMGKSGDVSSRYFIAILDHYRGSLSGKIRTLLCKINAITKLQ